MIKYVIVSIVSGILFGFLDGMINANPLAQKLNEIYKPIARTTINVPAGIVIDLAYGFIMAAVFLMIFKSLPGQSGLVKGVSFALLIWFFRVVMSAASSWMMYKVPIETVFYYLITGLVEMLILGVLYGLTLKSQTS
ncbi:MAG: hypothetical protein JXA96_12485 [Sedimentisphaerales bacterium]|nr:hypothetical protein [Sedimentisphaerales bacterium]